jgi:4-amino-4-deoxy-L-arabinose transferase-like glycosyltransferase
MPAMTDPANAARTGGWEASGVTGADGPWQTWLHRGWGPALFMLVVGLWFISLDARHLLRSDEGRYAEIAREMFASGDWVTIRYQGLKYFEKPPLHLWMTAMAYHAFGIGEWQARLWVGISGAAGLAVVGLVAQRWYGPRAGLLSAGALLAAPTWNISGHFNSLDMGVAAALTGVLGAVLMARHPRASPAAQRGWMLAGWAAMAVAVLTKGLIGIVLPALALAAYSAIARDWALWRRLQWLGGLSVFLVIAAPWFVLISVRNPEFAQFFFIHEHWERYTSSVHQRSAPAWYFVPQLLGGFFPWLGLVKTGAAAVSAESPQAGFRPLLFCAVWAGVVFGFFSLSGSKLPGYIVPVFPALALIAGAVLDRLDAPAWARQLRWLIAVCTLALLASGLVGRLPASEPNPELQAYAGWLMGGCALGVAGLLLAWRLNRRGRLTQSLVAAALALFGATTVGLAGHETLGRPSSGADLVPAIERVLTPSMPIYSVRLLDHTLPFYLARTTILVEDPDELAFGAQLEPQKWLATLAAFTQAWASGTPALAIMSPQTHVDLQTRGLSMQTVAADERRVVVANFVPSSQRGRPLPAP